MLDATGARGFAERARRELLATGQSVRKRTPQAGPRAGQAGYALTTQEAQVARPAGEGLSNPQISTRLFISPRTVQYHLRKVFTSRQSSPNWCCTIEAAAQTTLIVSRG